MKNGSYYLHQFSLTPYIDLFKVSYKVRYIYLCILDCVLILELVYIVVLEAQ